jgi:hypothetical protein
MCFARCLETHPPVPSIVDKATAALSYAENAVLHVHMVSTQNNGDGTVVTWDDERRP